MFQCSGVGFLCEAPAPKGGEGSHPQRRRCRPNCEESLTKGRLNLMQHCVLCSVQQIRNQCTGLDFKVLISASINGWKPKMHVIQSFSVLPQKI